MIVIPQRAARFLGAAGILISIALFFAANARADDDATVEMARQRFREGVQYFDQKQFEKARLAFLQAYALKPHPSILLNLAQSELRSGRPDEAATHFSDYLRTSTGTETERQEAELSFSSAKSKCGEVTVTVDAQGAEVSVDGQSKGQAPLPGPLFVPVGTHSLEARAADHRASKSVTLAAGQSATVNLALHAGSGAATAAVAATPATSSEEPSASPESTEPESPPAEAAENTEPSKESPEPSGGRKNFFRWFGESPIAWVGAGLTVAGITTGVIAGLTAKHDYDNANATESQILTERDQDVHDGLLSSPASAPCALSPTDLNLLQQRNPGRITEYGNACDLYNKNKSSGDSAKTVAIVGGVVAGVGLVGTIVYYFVDPNAEERASDGSSAAKAHFVPWIAPGSSGIVAVGQF
jgi:tetratricopeptide (TPR) repeat protein